ncbi:hypothetical protein Tco_0556418 [Tanacetum coccineum]
MKVRENDKLSAQHSRFLKMFKQLRLEIRLKDALVKMPKFNKWLSSLLKNKEKLEEIDITTVNAECSAIIMNKVLEKLEDPRKILIPCALQELNRTSALADSRASINLLPHSIYKKLRLEALTPTRMTLELANHYLKELKSVHDTFRVSKFEVFGKGEFAGAFTVSSDGGSDPLHHEFAGELLTLPSGNDREFGEYLSLMTLLCEISTFQSQENVHANQSLVIESFPVSPIPVEDNEPAQVEIDIFLVPDDLIPPGVKNDDSEDEDNELPNLDCDNHGLSRLVKPLVLTYVPVAMFGLYDFI